MNGHTPGPWSVQRGFLTIYATSRPDGTGTTNAVAKVSTAATAGGSRVGMDEADANAHLIAAAPDMLSALREIAEGAPEAEPEYDHWGGDTDRAETWGAEDQHWNLAQIARAAIAKAEGGAP